MVIRTSARQSLVISSCLFISFFVFLFPSSVHSKDSFLYVNDENVSFLGDCPIGTLKGQCHAGASCGEGFHCVQENEHCISCVKDPDVCRKHNGVSDKACENKCSASDCLKISFDPECYQCSSEMCSVGQKGTCGFDARCPAKTKCVQKENNCHVCQKIHDYNCPDGYKNGNCMINSGLCDEIGFCSQKNFYCHKCIPYGTPRCSSGQKEGPCPPGNCGRGEYCVTKGNNCHECKRITVTEDICENYAGFTSNCVDCRMDGKECLEGKTPPGTTLNCQQCVGCPDPYQTKLQCLGCEMFGGGKCVPVDVDSPVPCFTCIPANSCEAFGQFCDCYECYDDEICLPGKRITDEFGDEFVCKQCIPKNQVQKTQIPYIVVTIETPKGRITLNKGSVPGQFGDFIPQSVLALATPHPMIPDVAEDVPDLATLQEAFGDLSGASAGTLEEIIQKSQNKLHNKRDYSSDCFEDLVPASSKQNPPQTASSPNQTGSSSSGSGFGEDLKKDTILNGPILACGQLNGEDVLAIFDAHGALISMLSKKELRKNPEAFNQMLALAQNRNQEIAYKSQQVKVQQQSEKETLLSLNIKASTWDTPNDPLYMGSKNKKSNRSDKTPSIHSGMSLFKSVSSIQNKNGAQDQWGLLKVGYLPKSDSQSAWNQVDGEQKNVVVAVIDSGLDLAHPDGPEYIWQNSDEIPNNTIDDDQNGFVDDIHGWNFLNDNHDFTDFNGHGTFVAGIIAAKRNNGIGIAGINPGAVIMPIKVVDKEGNSNSLNIYRAIMYAVNNGARIINLSQGGRTISEIEQSAINYAHAHDVLVVVASGNNGLYLPELGPASARRVFTIGAVDMDGLLSPISSWGPNNALMAPGESIYSLRSKDSAKHQKNLYASRSGTSFSAPIVAATASLMLAQNPDLSKNELEDILTSTATDLNESGWDDLTGAGLLNAGQALKSRGSSTPSLKITDFRFNWAKGKVMSVDIFATVRGRLKEFALEIGKGKRANKFKQVAGPFTREAHNAWITTLKVKDHFKGSKEWMVQIKAKDKTGQEHTAKALLILTKEKDR